MNHRLSSNGAPGGPRTGTKVIATLLALGLPLSLFTLASCQTPPQRPAKSALRVEPVMTVSHGAKDAQAYYVLGRYYDGQNRHDQALAAYRSALDQDPHSFETHNAIGVVLGRQGRLDEAIASFEQAAALAPDAPHVLSNLGHALMLAGRNAEAVRALRRATALDPNSIKAWANLATALRRGGFGNDAELAMQRSVVLGLPRKAPATVRDTAVRPVAPVSAATSVVTAEPLQAMSSHMQAVEVAPNVVELRSAALTPKAVTVVALPVPNELAVTRAHPVPVAASVEPEPSLRLEIANGVGAVGAARRTGALLAHAGAPQARLVDQRPFVQQSTVVQFADGYQTQAMQIAGWIGTQPLLVNVPGLKAANVRVVVGRDLMPVLAASDVPDVSGTRLASAVSARAIASLR